MAVRGEHTKTIVDGPLIIGECKWFYIPHQRLFSVEAVPSRINSICGREIIAEGFDFGIMVPSSLGLGVVLPGPHASFRLAIPIRLCTSKTEELGLDV